ncbi:ADP-ribosylglycohydrolase family protein [Actinocatenispora rupis]|uniref:ADP-ribosylglycohydrolase n=1 Tax=Actinocatenispora rupis TaxID=519421 RepID=A0A8J3J2T8_9ACTN|nr:ADP-ribosylglycohydrolase family protein [Actinocatenispora rupis]GID09144.1 ADP-ribosylglycohydrolase [Actinocatenispora rupis]
MIDFRSRVRGCLLGGAIGDALGAPVEFRSLADIRARCGDAGVRGYLPYEGRFGAVTDDTQMTLFTVEGLIRAGVRTDRGIGFTTAVLRGAYDRWLDTQTLPGPPRQPDGVLAAQPWLYARRAPGTTCLTALTSARKGAATDGPAANDSKGCGTVMRSAPFGLLPGRDPGYVFDLAATAAGYTHGHVTGQLAAGAFAVLVDGLRRGQDLPTALAGARRVLVGHAGHEETTAALDAAVRAARERPVAAETVESLGGGWIAEEALAIAVYAALVHPAPDQVTDALALAVTHSGDSDSTGAICGNILGAWHGEDALPPELLFEVEGRGVLGELADDFVWEFTDARRRLHGEHGPHTRWTTRYPGA